MSDAISSRVRGTSTESERIAPSPALTWFGHPLPRGEREKMTSTDAVADAVVGWHAARKG